MWTKKPSAENEGKFVGITQDAQATQYKAVSVQKAGISYAVAAGVVAYGDAVGIADSAGKLKSVQSTMAAGLASPASVLYVVGYAETAAGADGDIFKVDIRPSVVPLAAS